MKTLHFSWSAAAAASYYRLFRQDGESGAEQLGPDLSGTEYALPISIHRFNWTSARFHVEACNTDGCTASSELKSPQSSGTIGYFKSSNSEAGDNFGTSVALSADGSTLAVGARYEDGGSTGVDGSQANDSATDSGAVYVFKRTDSGWTQQAYLKASNTGAGDSFGTSIALSANGDTLAVGAPFEESGATGVGGSQTDDSVGYAGAAYVFVRSGSAWSQEAYIKGSNTGRGDDFGYALALSGDGNTLAVGAVSEDSNARGIGGLQTDNSATYAGAVYVFARSGSSWTQQAYVKASNTEANDQFGWALALSADGSTMAVSASNESSAAVGVGGSQSNNSALYSGAVYVFTRLGATWSQQAYIKASNTDAGDIFGHALSLSSDGNTLAVGSYTEQSSATGVNGVQIDNTDDQAGAVYVFTRSGAAWAQRSYLKASNTGTGDGFGYSVSLSADGKALAVGAWQESSNAFGIGGTQTDNSAPHAGAVYFFEASGSSWSQTSYVKAPDTRSGDHFGTATALNADGSVLAVGAPYEASAARGIGGGEDDDSAPLAGAVYLY